VLSKTSIRSLEETEPSLLPSILVRPKLLSVVPPPFPLAQAPIALCSRPQEIRPRPNK